MRLNESSAISTLIKDFERKRNSLTSEEKIVHRNVLQSFSQLGRFPTAEEIKPALDLSSPIQVIKILEALEEKDMICLDKGTGKILVAYPFSEPATPHRVALENGREGNVMCALDALGVPFMLKQDVMVYSACHHCQNGVKVEVRCGKLVREEPQGIMAWIGYRRSFDCVATSLWPDINFFWSEEHLREWQERNPIREGEALELPEALSVSREIFGALLEEVMDSWGKENG